MAEILMTMATMALVFGAATILVALCAVGILKISRAMKKHAAQF